MRFVNTWSAEMVGEIRRLPGFHAGRFDERHKKLPADCGWKRMMVDQSYEEPPPSTTFFLLTSRCRIAPHACRHMRRPRRQPPHAAIADRGAARRAHTLAGELPSRSHRRQSFSARDVPEGAQPSGCRKAVAAHNVCLIRYCPPQ